MEELRSAPGLLALLDQPKIGVKRALAIALAGDLSAAGPAAEIDQTRLDASLVKAEQLIERHEQAGVSVLGRFDPDYPERLAELADAPPVLFVRGPLGLLSERRLCAVVGTREPSAFGISATKAVVGALAREQFGIVSGLALGIDSEAHRAALEHGLPTVAVLGGGLDLIHPRANAPLAEQILSAGGVLCSEYPFGTRNEAHTLVARDRIQSGLSCAVVACQAEARSGTMHTARFAAAQGRPLFCPRPHADHPRSEGLRLLLESPASELEHLLPAFSGQGKLCRSLGSEPLARPLERGQLSSWALQLAAQS